MNIIIPLGGKGERFLNQGYKSPKPLIPVGHKEMIRHVIDRLVLDTDDKVIILYYNQLDKHEFAKTIHKSYPDIELVPIPFQTRGAVETIDWGLRSMKNDGKDEDRQCLLIDCDAFYTCDIVSMAREHKNGVFVFEENVANIGSIPPKFSYVSVQNEWAITDIAEKKRISRYANTGAYLFESKKLLLEYTGKVLSSDFRFRGEFYTSCAIKLMLLDNHSFDAIPIEFSDYTSLGTPEQLKEYIEKCHAFFFDLDGTLVDTMDMYVHVWKKLLEPYNAQVDKSFFRNYIDGNNDHIAMQLLIPSLTPSEIKRLSHQKDELFIECLDQLKIIQGASDFIDNVRRKGHTIGIVTNCNRRAAESIIRYCGLSDKIDILVIGNECKRPKPHPDPYQTAQQVSGIAHKRVIIFEDSITGIMSARGISPKSIVAINARKSDENFIQDLSDMMMDDFSDLDIEDVLQHKDTNESIRLERMIYESIAARYSHLKKVVILPDKLKGGYIADVIRVDLVMENEEIIQCVAKLQSQTVSNLSDMATELGLYTREQYFYEAIRDHIQISAPRYFGTIRGHDMQSRGILLEYLPSPQYQLGVDLENVSMDLTLHLIRRLAAHHARFWGKDLQRAFPQLTKNNDKSFLGWSDYVQKRWGLFEERWKSILTADQLEMGRKIVSIFDKVQQYLSHGCLTLCHGDVKSPNIFFSKEDEPYFIDWQYIIMGKGVQDLVFLMIESFSVSAISRVGPTLKNYYYIALQEEGVKNYDRKDYDIDFQASICYFPFFVAMWFGTTPSNQLIDVNFPFFFIQKLFSFINNYVSDELFLNLKI